MGGLVSTSTLLVKPGAIVVVVVAVVDEGWICCLLTSMSSFLIVIELDGALMRLAPMMLFESILIGLAIGVTIGCFMNWLTDCLAFSNSRTKSLGNKYAMK